MEFLQLIPVLFLILIGLAVVSVIFLISARGIDLILSLFGFGNNQRMNRVAQRLNLEYDSKKHEFHGEIKGFRVRLFYRYQGRSGSYVISVLSDTDIGKIFTLDSFSLKLMFFSEKFTGDKAFDRLYAVKGLDRKKILEILDKDIRNRLIGLRDSGYLTITQNSEYEYSGFQRKLFIEKSAPFAMKEVLTVIEAIENKVRQVLHHPECEHRA